MAKTPDHQLELFHYFTAFDPVQVIGGIRARYPESYAFTLGYEGGYVNDPNDPGGCANAGITIGTLQAWRGASMTVTCEDVAALTEPEIGMIYATNYWAPVWGNRLPVGINCQVWDFGVNAGPSRAIKTLQACIGTKQDGIMGPDTLGTTMERDSDELLQEYHERRQAYYESLDGWVHYGTGWTNRNNDCLTLSLDLRAKGALTIPRPGVGLTAERLDVLERWAESIKKGTP